MKYSKEELLKMYYHLARGRVFTLKMHEAVIAGHVRSSFHTPYGQEAIAVAVACSADKNDWLVPNHRDQCASIMRVDLYKFIAELFGKEDGLHKGVAFDFHCSDLTEGVRLAPPLAVLGGVVPNYVGFAWSLKQQKKNEVAIAFTGDGACSEGAIYEGWNLAALYKVPFIQIIENNGWAMTVPLDRQTANPDIAKKAEACGLPIQIVDGNNILEVREAMDKALEMARNNQPNVIEVKTLRWEAHFFGQGDDYRDDKEEVKESMEKDDCLKNYEKYLLDNGVCTQEYMDELKEQLSDEIDAMVQKAAEAPIADPKTIYTKENIYATAETGGDL